MHLAAGVGGEPPLSPQGLQASYCVVIVRVAGAVSAFSTWQPPGQPSPINHLGVGGPWWHWPGDLARDGGVSFSPSAISVSAI
jgi:hypothetical protein